MNDDMYKVFNDFANENSIFRKISYSNGTATLILLDKFNKEKLKIEYHPIGVSEKSYISLKYKENDKEKEVQVHSKDELENSLYSIYSKNYIDIMLNDRKIAYRQISPIEFEIDGNTFSFHRNLDLLKKNAETYASLSFNNDITDEYRKKADLCAKNHARIKINYDSMKKYNPNFTTSEQDYLILNNFEPYKRLDEIKNTVKQKIESLENVLDIIYNYVSVCFNSKKSFENVFSKYISKEKLFDKNNIKDVRDFLNSYLEISNPVIGTYTHLSSYIDLRDKLNIVMNNIEKEIYKLETFITNLNDYYNKKCNDEYITSKKKTELFRNLEEKWGKLSVFKKAVYKIRRKDLESIRNKMTASADINVNDYENLYGGRAR